MTDVELSSLLSDLRISANKLNSATSGVNAIIDGVEAQLTGMNLGLEYWLKSPGLDSQSLDMGTIVHTQLGFAKIGNEWCLGVRRVQVELDERSGEWTHTEPDPSAKLQDSSREIRIKALELIPKLIEELKESAEKATSTIVNAKKLVGWQ
jgi:hypothetical protein